MTIFIIISTLVVILISLIGLYYQRQQSKPKVNNTPSTAIKANNINGLVMRGNKSYGYDTLADISDSENVETSDNEAHR